MRARSGFQSFSGLNPVLKSSETVSSSVEAGSTAAVSLSRPFGPFARRRIRCKANTRSTAAKFVLPSDRCWSTACRRRWARARSTCCVALIERRDRVVEKAELFDTVWPGLVVEENNLQVQVSSLRKLLGAERDRDRARPRLPVRRAGRGDGAGTGAEPAAHARTPPTSRTPRTRFIGREAALADCADAAAATRGCSRCRGIGGCGKTRLAQELAQRELGAFPDGVWFVDLATAAGGAARVGTVRVDARRAGCGPAHAPITSRRGAR